MFDTTMANPLSGTERCTVLQAHLLIIIKSAIVLSGWIFGYAGIKHLPITIAGPINATRPVLVLVGAMVIFGERLNLFQWTGIILSAVSLFLLSLSSRKENISFMCGAMIFKEKNLLHLFPDRPHGMSVIEPLFHSIFGKQSVSLAEF